MRTFTQEGWPSAPTSVSARSSSPIGRPALGMCPATTNVPWGVRAMTSAVKSARRAGAPPSTSAEPDSEASPLEASASLPGLPPSLAGGMVPPASVPATPLLASPEPPHDVAAIARSGPEAISEISAHLLAVFIVRPRIRSGVLSVGLDALVHSRDSIQLLLFR
jgi:hypothetical protein